MDALNNSANDTSERHGEVSPCTTLHGNHPLDTSGPAQERSSNVKSPPDEDNTSVLVVDWDGPDDPQNPKK